MRVKSLLSGKTFDAEVTTDHPCSSYGQAVVVIDGDAVDPIGLVIVKVSEEERASLPPWWTPPA